MNRGNYAARHSIPPNIRLGIGIGLRVGGLGDVGQPAPTFRPNVVAPSGLAGAKRGLSQAVTRLNEVLASLAPEAEGDELFSHEMKLVRAQIVRLAEML